MLIKKINAQKKLSIFWFLNAAVLTILFIVFTVFNRFDNKVLNAWEWLSQNIIPTITLMIGTFYMNVNQENKEKEIDIIYYRLCYGISLFLFVLYT